LRRARAWGGPLLAAASTLAVLAGAEASFRVAAHLENAGLLPAIDDTPPPPRGVRATLGQMIRRSRNPRIVYELRPLLDVEYSRARVTTGEDGFRTTPARPPARGAAAIVGIGDSYMFGQGVADEQAYLAVLQRALQASAPGRWHVVNTAVPGYNTVMEVETLEEKGLALAPRLVVLELVGNDIDLPNFIRAPQPVFAADRSFLADFVRRRLRRLRGRPTRAADGVDDGLQAAPQFEDEGVLRFETDPARVPPEYAGMVGWPAFDRALRDLSALREAHGFQVVVVSQAPGGDWFTRDARRLSRELGFHYLDVGRALRAWLRERGLERFQGSPLAVSDDDPHPSALGHEVAAQALLRFLGERGLLDTAGPAAVDGPPPPP
jgi:lysophospholipase L1-like esterase